MANNSSAEIDIWTTPMLPPPPGVIPNFVNPVSRGPMIRAGMYSLLAIMAVFVLLRIYTRVRLTRALGSDDYLCVLSAATITTYSALVISFMDHPEGRHGWDIPLGEVLDNHYWLEATLSSLLVYCLGNMFTKLTLLSLYLRIFKPATWSRVLIWLGIVATILFYVATFIAYIGLCAHSGVPIWLSMEELRCANGNLTVAQAQGWYGLLSDIYILALPLALVWRLKLNTRRKLGVMAVFLTGLAAIAISTVSLSVRYAAVKQGADRTWDNCILFLYATIELVIGLICSCMPVIAGTLKSSMVSMNLMWDSIKMYGIHILTRTSRQSLKLPSHSSSKEQLREIPSGTISGIRTFIQKICRSNNRSVNDPTHPATFDNIDSVDEHYHVQLKQMYNHELRV